MKPLHADSCWRNTLSMRLLVGLITLVTAGCASKIILLPRDGGESITGIMSSVGSMAVTLHGRDYRGNYVTTDGGPTTGTFNSYGRRFRTGTFNAYTSPKNARALLVAADGNTLRCEFTFGGEGGLGSCTGSDRQQYDLMIRND